MKMTIIEHWPKGTALRPRKGPRANDLLRKLSGKPNVNGL